MVFLGHIGLNSCPAKTLVCRLSRPESKRFYAQQRLADFHDAFFYIKRQFDLSRGLVIAVENDRPPGCCCLPEIAP